MQNSCSAKEAFDRSPEGGKGLKWFRPVQVNSSRGSKIFKKQSPIYCYSHQRSDDKSANFQMIKKAMYTVSGFAAQLTGNDSVTGICTHKNTSECQ